MSLNSYNNYISQCCDYVYSIGVELKLREVKQYAYDHTAREVKSWDLSLVRSDCKICFYLPVPTNLPAHICCPFSSFLPFFFPPLYKVRRYQRNKTKQKKLFSDKSSSSQYYSEENILTETLRKHYISLDSLYLAHTVTIDLQSIPLSDVVLAKKPQSLTDNANSQQARLLLQQQGSERTTCETSVKGLSRRHSRFAFSA